jgi:general stress protein YciG
MSMTPDGEKNTSKKGSKRGFAAMDENKQRELARRGGKSVLPEHRGFSRDPQLASQAGRKGGQSVPPEERYFSKHRELARQAGKKGGEASVRQRSVERRSHGRQSE